MNGAFGFFINPSEPSSYDVVMDIVRPYLLQDRVHTQDSDSWNFGDYWPDRDDRVLIVQSLRRAYPTRRSTSLRGEVQAVPIVWS